MTKVTFIISFLILIGVFLESKSKDLPNLIQANVDLIQDQLLNTNASTITQNNKLYPNPAGLVGETTDFGENSVVFGNTAMVAGTSLLDGGAVVVYQFENGEWNQVAVLQPESVVPRDQFGSSLGLSENVAVIASPGSADNNSMVYVYVKSENSWQLASTIVTETPQYSSNNFGDSVSIYEDKIVIGDSGDSEFGNSTGAFHFYSLKDNVWTFEAKVSPLKIVVGGGFGSKVNLHQNRLIVSAPKDNENGTASGAVYVFDYDGKLWNETAKLTPSDSEEFDYFGGNIVVNNDTIMVGQPNDYNANGVSAGAVYVFNYNDNVWSESVKLIPSDGESFDSFGHSIDLSQGIAIIGAVGDDKNPQVSGSIYVFELTNEGWLQTDKLIAAQQSTSEKFGQSVNFFNNNLIVGSLGSAHIFKRLNGSWQYEVELSLDKGSEGDQFGQSVSLSGPRILVGAPRDNDNVGKAGSAYIFELINNEQWVLQAKLHGDIRTEESYFGYAVSLDENRALISAYADATAYIFDYVDSEWVKTKLLTTENWVASAFGFSVDLNENYALVGDPESGSGAVYLYNYTQENWELSQRLFSINASQTARFGDSVRKEGSYIVIGAPSDNEFGYEAGAVYVFENIGNQWVEQQKLVPINSVTNGRFGKTVSISGDKLLIGSSRDDADNLSAYVFRLEDNEWVQEAVLNFAADNVLSTDIHSVDLSGNTAAVGIIDFDGKGSTNIFQFSDGAWELMHRLIAKDGRSEDLFGNSVSLEGTEVVVGSRHDDDQGTNSGSVYYFDLDLIFKQGFDL